VEKISNRTIKTLKPNTAPRVAAVLSLMLLVFVLLLFLYALRDSGTQKAALHLQDGQLDFAEYDLQQTEVIQLNGQWEFYWLQLLEQKDFNHGKHVKPLSATVPDTWNSIKSEDGRNLPGFGYGTYRLRVENFSSSAPFSGIYVSSIATSFKLYINDHLVSSQGLVGTEPSAVRPRHARAVAYFPTPGESFDLIIQAANFSYPRGGIWEDIYFGSEEAINSLLYERISRQLILFGALLMIVIFSLVIHIFRKEAISSLYLALTCIFLIILYDSLNLSMIYDVFPDISFDTVVRAWFLSTVLAPYFLVLFINEIFPTVYARFSNIIFTVFTLLFMLFYLFFPIRQVGLDLYFGNIIPLLELLYTILIAALAYKLRMKGSAFYLAGLLIGFITITHDILHINHVIKSPLGEILFYGLFAFTFCLAAAQGFHFIDTTEQATRAEMRFLQSQIRPHFVHNALNAIISISRKDPDRSRKLLVEFSHYLRNSFDFKDLDQKIPIEQEINLIRSYAVLERARFGDKIAFNFELDDISFRIPPLLLQPLVENAVIHGLRPKSGPGEITVYIKKEGAHALLGVKDDGVGMPEAVMHKIKNQQTIVSNSEGIGLQNIAQRLRNIYGATLQVTSTAGAGSEVFMLIPMQGVK